MFVLMLSSLKCNGNRRLQRMVVQFEAGSGQLSHELFVSGFCSFFSGFHLDRFRFWSDAVMTKMKRI